MSKFQPEIIYEDEVLLVASKPAGLLSIPGRYDKGEPSLLSLLNEHYTRVLTVHRIDRDTSGLIAFARNEEAHKHLSQQFEARSTRKTYLALLDGRPLQAEGIIDSPIAADPAHPGKMKTARKGKAARTSYRILENFRAFSLAEVEIETGRTHQIRVHFASIGYPLAIDALYGRREALLLSDIKQRGYHLGRGQEERPLMSRLSLHAWKLELEHPATGQPMAFEAPLPKDLSAVLRQLRKWGN
ncbi:MAG: RluA family pseudouridine synthase [Phaeodactylibacter sp.]|nr:RluA family pseudouridine synthase [Phaeodactylibacter sp.]MCB9275313.1 RluA family pseudouridine synthase [Lewinellaceae bacterium]